jgi:hypothetical protein
MSKQGKILLGILSMLPLVLLGIYTLLFMNVFATSFSQTTQKDGPPVFVLQGWNELLVTLAIFIALTLGLLIYYINHAISNQKIDGPDRIVWVLIFLFAGIVGYPVYWYMKIWRTTPPKWQVARRE